MSNDTVKIGINVIVIGLIVGIVASLWNILPFFVLGVRNIFFITTVLAIIFLLALSRLKKEVIVKSGVSALVVFLLMSFAIVPFVSGFILNNDIDISQSASEGLETLNLELPGLFCQGCAYSAQNALKGIDGVTDAKVSFEAKKGTIVYDPNKVSPDEILANDLIKAYGGNIG